MSKLIARLVPYSMLLAGLLVAGPVDTARAQPTAGVDKRLCIGNPTPTTISACLAGIPVTGVSPYTPIFYVINLSNAATGAPGSVNVTDTFQPGFNFVNATCTATGTSNPCPAFIAGASGAITSAAASATPFSTPVNLGPLPLQTNQSVQIVIKGYFSLPGSGTANNSVAVTGGTAPVTAGAQAQVDPSHQLPNDLSITKIVLPPPPPPVDVSNGPKIVRYRVVIANSGPDVYLGQLLTLNDELRIPLTGAPLQATFVPGSATCTASAGSDCLAVTPTLNTSSSGPLIVGTFTWAPFLKWRYPTTSAGLLLSGGTITFEWNVRVERLLDCVKQQSGGDFLLNHAFFNLTTTSGITITEQNPANNSSDTPPNTNSDVPVITGAFIVDPFCGVTTPGAPPPLLAITKTQLPPLGPVAWPGNAMYSIQLKNNGTTPIVGINLRDFMREDPGTPPHDVQLIAWNCFSTPPGAGCLGVIPPLSGPVQSQQFYFSAKQIWSGTIPILLPQQTLTLTLNVRFSNPTCDSLDATQPNTNTNLARASYNATVLIASVPTPVTYQLQAAVTTPMAAVPKCQFNVVKQFVGPTPVGFPQTTNYTIQFKSLETVPRNIVVYDALRVVPANLTAGMPFTATFSCFPNTLGSVAGPIPGFPVQGSTSGTVVNTTLPSQGVRIFQSAGFLTFQPGATLTCNVSVTVSRPPPNDPFCLGTAPGGQKENLAYMTVSLIPNNNVFPPSGTYNGTWPLAASQPAVSPSNWRSLTDLLPRCFNLVVNKHPNMTTTWTPGGPGIIYTMSVTNAGANPITPGPNNPVLTDTFNPNRVATTFTSTCSPAAPACAFTWNPNPTGGNPSTLTITTLAAGQTINTTFTVPGPFTVPLQANSAVAAMGGPNGGQLWYPKNPATLTATATVAVLQTNSLTVKKTVSAPPPPSGGLPNLTGVVFPVNVVCTPFGPSPSVTLTAPTLSQVIPNIPVGSTCNVVEQLLTSTGTCGKPLVSVLLPPPTYVPVQNVPIPAPPASPSVEVHNVMACVPVPPSACVLDPGMVAASNTFARRVTLAQTFTPTQTGSLTQITHGLQGLSGSVANYQLLVTTTTGGLPSWTGGSTSTPNVLVSMPALTIFSNSGIVNGVVQIPAGQQPVVTAGTQYAVILIPGTPTTGTMAWRGNSGAGTYPNGSAYELNGTTWSVPGTGPKDHGFKLDGLCPPISTTGSLRVEKKMGPVAGAVPPIPPGITFPVQVACTPSGPNQIVNLTAAAPSVTLPNIISGSVCTLTELPPVGPILSNCHWGPVTYPIGQIATIPAQSTIERFVQNTLVCPSSACVLDPGVLATNNTFERRATLAQTFTPTQTGSLTQVTHRLHKVFDTIENYDLLVTTTTGGLPSWTGGPSTTPNVLLAMTGLTVFATGSSNGVVPIPAGQQPHLIAGTQYALILLPGTPTAGLMYWQGSVDPASYPNGSAYELSGTTWSVPGIGPKDHGFKLDGQCP